MKNLRLYNANPPNMPQGSPPLATNPAAPTPAVPAVPAVETEDQKRIKKLESENREYQQTNSALLNKVANLTPAKPVNQPATPPNPADQRSKWWTDPDAAFAERAAPLVQATTQTQVYLIKEQMKVKYAKEFKLWSSEIDELANPLNPMYLMDPATWEIIIERVRGRHVQEYARDPSMVPGYSESSSPSDPPAPKTAQQQLTDRELKIAKQLGVTPEKYLAQKSKMTVGV